MGGGWGRWSPTAPSPTLPRLRRERGPCRRRPNLPPPLQRGRVGEGATAATLPTSGKLSVPPSTGPSTVDAIRRKLDIEAFYDWGGGLVWLAAPPDSGTTIRSALSAGGHATLVRAPEAVRAATDVFQPLPEPLMALSRRVKESFDPKGILNPGRMYAGL
ncbi:FAD-linked oxidase C-terminal domain-containing protein [Azospirillum sp. INR13]|uniref:FAD-linked oxidase C-terminal domain-containing protein n=1 Tax=Azospirillum sp. INR13 TaxID=2596919 RepID=UPI00351C2642